MRPLYAASMVLGDDSSKVTLEDVIFRARGWARKKFGNRAIHGFYDGCSWNENRNSLDTMMVRHKGKRLFSMRLTHPGGSDRDLFWRTTFCAGEREPGDEKKKTHDVSITVETGSATGDVAPVNFNFVRPWLVMDLIMNFNAYAGPYPLMDKAIIGESPRRLAYMVNSKDRMLPVMVVTKTHNEGTYPFNPDELNNRLAGLAHVVMVEDNTRGWYSFSRSFERHSERRRGCYNGAVKLYWPSHDTSIRDRFWMNADAVKPDFIDEVSEMLARISIHRKLSLSYNHVIGAVNAERVSSMQDRITSMLAELDDSEMVKELEGVVGLFEAENTGLKARVDELEQTVRELEAKNLNLGYALEKADVAKRTSDVPVYDPSTDVHSIVDAVAAVQREYPDSPLIILDKANSMAKKFTYRDPVQVYRALEWLATSYADARVDGNGKSIAELAREQIGMTYKSGQSESTMGENPRDYFVKWNGENRALEEHLGKGNSKGNMIRIGFFYASDTRQVVVGYIGNHQKNRRS